MNRHPARDVAQDRDEWDERESDRQCRHHDDDPEVCVATIQAEESGVAVEGKNLVPHRVEPKPGLSGILAGLVHHSPLVSVEAPLVGEAVQVTAVPDEQKGGRVVGLVEPAVDLQQAVQSSGLTHRQEVGRHHRQWAVVAVRNCDGSVRRLSVLEGLRVGVSPRCLLIRSG